MPNPYFKFKQFTIHHDQCAMKVGTDGVLLGTWADVSDAETALDIGTGTGLIALMIAQRNAKLRIDAIDINEEAICQAVENVNNSPFSSRISCKHQSLQEFYRKSECKFDVIVSNPPFFTDSLKSAGIGRTLARHTDELSMEELMSVSSNMLSDRGQLSIIYPSDQKKNLISLAEKNDLYMYRVTNVYPKTESQPKRVLLGFTKSNLPLAENNLIIEKERHVYSDDFIRLVKDFYLKM